MNMLNAFVFKIEKRQFDFWRLKNIYSENSHYDRQMYLFFFTSQSQYYCRVARHFALKNPKLSAGWIKAVISRVFACASDPSQVTLHHSYFWTMMELLISLQGKTRITLLKRRIEEGKTRITLLKQPSQFNYQAMYVQNHDTHHMCSKIANELNNVISTCQQTQINCCYASNVYLLENHSSKIRD